MEALNKAERLALDSVAETSVHGITRGIDTSSDTTKRSGELIMAASTNQQSLTTMLAQLKSSTSNQTFNAIKSNRIVNSEIRAKEFKTLLAENKRTNELLQIETLVSLKQAKYTAKGYI